MTRFKRKNTAPEPKKGRHKKVSAEEVREFLEQNGPVTKTEIASYFGCHPATIGSRLRELRIDQVAIPFDRNGLWLLNKADMEDQEKALGLQQFVNWVVSVAKGAAICARPTKPLLPKMRKTLLENMSKEERQQLKIGSARLLTLLTYAEADEEI